jgi:hypothetical protein
MVVVDSRRQETIEIVEISPQIYHLTIGGVLWSEVEWSPKRGDVVHPGRGWSLSYPCRTYARRGKRPLGSNPRR